METYGNVHGQPNENEAADLLNSPDKWTPPEDVELMGILGELGNDSAVRIRVYRVIDGNYRQQEFVWECSPAEFQLSTLQAKFGGGEYRICPRGKSGLIRNIPVRIAAPVQHDPVAGQIDQRFSRLEGLIEKLAGAVVQAQTPPAQSRKDMLEELAMMRDIFGGGPAPVAAAGDPFDQVTKLLALARDVRKLTGDAPAEPPDGLTVLAETAKSVLPAIVAASQAQRPQMAPVPSMRAPAPHHAPPPSPDSQAPAAGDAALAQPQPQNTEDEMRAMQAMQIKGYLALLIKDAEQDLDPTGWAHMIINHVGHDSIDAMLRPDNWFDQLSTFEPKVIPFREWFTEMREMVFELLSGDGGAGTTGGNSPDGTNHASGAAANPNTEGHS